MELAVDNVEIDSFGVQADVGQFGIKDMGFVLDILRNKLYSNIVKAICQEYSCNARDAHREVGKPEIPVKITLPNSFEPYWKCRDFGPGISTSRMTDIFLQYGASTKRKDNTQTGGYGIGAKCAFGYTDSFSINTFIDGIKRSYTCVIDDTRCGKIVLMGEIATDEPNGTEIIIPVKYSNFKSFRDETVRACLFWEVRPEISGATVDWDTEMKEFTPSLKGEDWFFTPPRHQYDSEKNLFLIIDGVIYRTVYTDFVKQLHCRNGNLFIRFNTGEINISPNREMIEKNEKNTKQINSRIQKIVSQLTKNINDQIINAESYIQACLIADRLIPQFNFPAKVTDYSWNGVPLHATNYHHNEMDVLVRHRSTSQSTPNAFSKLGRKNYTRNDFVIDTNFGTKTLIVLVPSSQNFDNGIDKTLENIGKNFPKAETLLLVRTTDKVIKDLNLEILNPINFLDYRVETKNRAKALDRLSFFLLGGSDGIGDKFTRSSLEVYKNCKAKKVWVMISDDQQTMILNDKDARNGKIVVGLSNFNRYMKSLFKDEKYMIFGFKSSTKVEKLDEILTDAVSLDSLIEKDIKTMNLAEMGFVTKETMRNYGRNPGLPFQPNWFENASQIIKNSNHLFFNLLTKVTELQNLIKTYENKMFLVCFQSVYQSLDGYHGEKTNLIGKMATIHKLTKQLLEKYPLFEAVVTMSEERTMYGENDSRRWNTYCLSSLFKEDKQFLDHVLQYMNMVDEMEKDSTVTETVQQELQSESV